MQAKQKMILSTTHGLANDEHPAATTRTVIEHPVDALEDAVHFLGPGSKANCVENEGRPTIARTDHHVYRFQRKVMLTNPIIPDVGHDLMHCLLILRRILPAARMRDLGAPGNFWIMQTLVLYCGQLPGTY